MLTSSSQVNLKVSAPKPQSASPCPSTRGTQRTVFHNLRLSQGSGSGDSGSINLGMSTSLIPRPQAQFPATAATSSPPPGVPPAPGLGSPLPPGLGSPLLPPGPDALLPPSLAPWSSSSQSSLCRAAWVPPSEHHVVTSHLAGFACLTHFGSFCCLDVVRPTAVWAPTPSLAGYRPLWSRPHSLPGAPCPCQSLAGAASVLYGLFLLPPRIPVCSAVLHRVVMLPPSCHVTFIHVII